MIREVIWRAGLNFLTEAMDRIHRLGQYRPVKAIKLVIEDSIESRIIQVSECHVSKVVCLCLHDLLQLQEKKSAMVDATLSTDDSVRILSSDSPVFF